MGASPQNEVLCVIGTRPEAVKMAPVAHELRRQPWAKLRVLATGQHRELLHDTLSFFETPPDETLDVMRPGQSLAQLTSRLATRIDAQLAQRPPALALAQGDTTTVLATALCCFYRQIPFGHVEAGLRTGDLLAPFPEEMNRSVSGQLATLNFAPTAAARDNLLREGVSPRRIYVTGNTVVDALHWAAGRSLPPAPPQLAGRRTLLVTVHRRENLGPRLWEICDALREIVARRDVSVLFPAHPNPRVAQTVARRLGDAANIIITGPLDYPGFVAAMRQACLVLTDSGGVQEEAPALGKPLLVLRDSTERPEGVACGAAALVGARRDAIVSETLRLLDDADAYRRMAQVRHVYGDGQAAQRIVAALRCFLNPRRRAPVGHRRTRVAARRGGRPVAA